MPTEASQIGQVLREGRTRAGLSQADAAQRVGIDSVTLSRYERGKLLAPQPTRIALATLYSIPIESLGLKAGSLGSVPRGAIAGPSVGEAVVEGYAPTVEVGPRLARNLPLAVREYLLEVRGRFTRANVPEEMIDEAMDLLRSPSVFSYFKGGRLAEYNERDVLDGMRTLVDDVVVQRLKKLGFKVP